MFFLLKNYKHANYLGDFNLNFATEICWKNYNQEVDVVGLKREMENVHTTHTQ